MIPFSLDMLAQMQGGAPPDPNAPDNGQGQPPQLLSLLPPPQPQPFQLPHPGANAANAALGGSTGLIGALVHGLLANKMAENQQARQQYEYARQAAYQEWMDKNKGIAEQNRINLTASAKPEKSTEPLFMLSPDIVKKAGVMNYKPGDMVSATVFNALRAEADRNSPRPSSGLMGTGGINLTPEAKQLAARQYLATGQIPALGMGAAGRIGVLNEAASLDPQASVAGNQAEFRASQASLAQVQKMLDAVTAFENTALANVKVLQDRMAKVPDTGSPLMNMPVRMLAGQAMGSTEMAAYRTALQVVQPEFAKILNNPNMAGQLTDNARREMADAMSPNATLAQMNAIVETLVRDAHNRRLAYKQQISDISGRIRGTGQSAAPADDGVPAAQPARTLKKGGFFDSIINGGR